MNIIGAGLAGCEASWQLAKRGIGVNLYEMRPVKSTAVHETGNFAELVCSNSLGSINYPNASCLLKEEMKILGSLILEAALCSKVPAGRALAVERKNFSAYITDKISANGKIKIIRGEVKEISKDEITIIASGPLTSDTLAKEISKLTGDEFLYFYDAVSPIIDGSSIDMNKAFWGARYEDDSDDYLNIPLKKDEYFSFVNELKNARVIPVNKADENSFFDGCMPIEVMALRGEKSLAFGPMRPVGFRKRIGDDLFAIIQLRKEDNKSSMFNMVGFQTRMTFSEQKRVFKTLPALKNARFLRLGKMHRNTYINSRKILDNVLSHHKYNTIYFAGQINGVEGYLESAASGLAVSLYITSRLLGTEVENLPLQTMMGSLLDSVTSKEYGIDDFTPQNANMGILRRHFNLLDIPKSQIKSTIFDKSIENIKQWSLQNFKL